MYRGRHDARASLAPDALPEVLEDLVGTTALRPGQREAIASVLP
ncbi:MAG: hypothetical protein ABJA87_00710 [bacterium]